MEPAKLQLIDAELDKGNSRRPAGSGRSRPLQLIDAEPDKGNGGPMVRPGAEASQQAEEDCSPWI